MHAWRDFDHYLFKNKMAHVLMPIDQLRRTAQHTHIFGYKWSHESYHHTIKEWIIWLQRMYPCRASAFSRNQRSARTEVSGLAVAVLSTMTTSCSEGGSGNAASSGAASAGLHTPSTAAAEARRARRLDPAREPATRKRVGELHN
jgi:hypothetical protein